MSQTVNYVSLISLDVVTDSEMYIEECKLERFTVESHDDVWRL